MRSTTLGGAAENSMCDSDAARTQRWRMWAVVLRATLITVAVGVIVYKCKKWCADVVARIEAWVVHYKRRRHVL